MEKRLHEVRRAAGERRGSAVSPEELLKACLQVGVDLAPGYTPGRPARGWHMTMVEAKKAERLIQVICSSEEEA